jgi:hypothetical protein
METVIGSVIHPEMDWKSIGVKLDWLEGLYFEGSTPNKDNVIGYCRGKNEWEVRLHKC